MKPGRPIPVPNYAEYERRKQAWVDEQLKQPSVTPGAYDIAIRKIARECGV